MGRLFGTDGVRGLANADLTPELALAVAVAAARTLAEADRSHPPLAVVGRDPRASGEMLEAAVVAGLTSAGANVVRVGVLPTPGGRVPDRRVEGRPRRDALRLAQPDARQRHQALRRRRAQAARRDRGRGSRPRSATGTAGWTRPTGASVGRVHDLLDGAEHYVQHLVGSTPHQLDGHQGRRRLRQRRGVRRRPEAYREAGAEVIAIHAEPDGLNINDGLRLDPPRRRSGPPSLEHGADLGIALDGDADRCLAVTADGDEVDGDQIMAILALAMREAGTLTERHAGRAR